MQRLGNCRLGGGLIQHIRSRFKGKVKRKKLRKNQKILSASLGGKFPTFFITHMDLGKKTQGLVLASGSVSLVVNTDLIGRDEVRLNCGRWRRN